MKKTLFIASLLALALTACDNKDATDNQATTEQATPAVDNSAAQVAPTQPAEQVAPATEATTPAKDDTSAQLMPAQSTEQVAISADPAPPEENSLD